MNVQVESEKVGLKLNIQKTQIMASGPITSWEIVTKQEVNSHMNQNLGTFTVDEILGASGTKSLPPNARY